jgi:hypothetical protein
MPFRQLFEMLLLLHQTAAEAEILKNGTVLISDSKRNKDMYTCVAFVAYL